jgi:hypothetical protein
MHNHNESHNKQWTVEIPLKIHCKFIFEINMGLVINKKAEYKHLVHGKMNNGIVIISTFNIIHSVARKFRVKGFFYPPCCLSSRIPGSV